MMEKNIDTAIGVLNNHGLIEEANKLNEITKTCDCNDCREYRFNVEMYDQFYLVQEAKKIKSLHEIAERILRTTDGNSVIGEFVSRCVLKLEDEYRTTCNMIDQIKGKKTYWGIIGGD